MIRVLIFIALVFAAALGLAWVADRPGMLTLDWQGYRIETGLMTAAVALVAFVALAIIAWNVVLVILRSPDLLGRFWRRRRKDRGYAALSKGMLALGVGDAAAATRHGGEAAKLLKGDPASALLLAQTAQLAGRHDEARARFEKMLEDPALRPVGLHGLYVEAERLDEPVAARHYAEEAAALVPGLDWAGRAVLGYQAVAGDWADAIKTLEKNYAAKLIDKKTFRRHKAVLLTAHALEQEDRDPDGARALANEAAGLAPGLVPAAVLAARLATRRGDIRKALKVVEAAWKVTPHPELAEAYAHARTGDSAQDRLKRVKALAALRAHSTEGTLALARAAIEAGDFALARTQLKGALRNAPTQRAFLMMADLEEKEHGDRGRVREWLARAVRAPADPMWVTEGAVSETWAPVSPVDGRLDAFEWTTPPATLDHHGDALEAIDDALLEALPEPVRGAEDDALVILPSTPTEAEDATSGDAEVPAVTSAPQPERAAAKAEKPEAEAAKPAEAKPTAGDASPAKTEAPQRMEPAPEKKAATGDGAARVGDAAKPAPESGTGKAAPAKGPGSVADVIAGGDASRPIEFPLKHMPDDPGPEGDEDDEAPRKPGFRFFN
ncbi:heme biosynthesis protein HemY [Stappia indica]|uniref:heme biosynthesis protein HemY n=1 Tax=Stappia indica TaxID=538381 RepID=UPI001CD3BB26|nr:heme biosynthesis HemY N-terminal domain-containing protein [Stappia indica]MCA1299770.1 heme biosynthesis protein HemY [Stappia indica]